MHDAGTGLERHVFAEIDRRAALVERMLEADVLQGAAFAGRERLPRKLVAGEAGLLQLGREDQQPLRRVYEVVDELGVDVQRLVARQRPRRRRPDDRETGLVHLDAERFRELLRLGERKATSIAGSLRSAYSTS